MGKTLHHELVHAPDTAPTRWLYVMHGIFGAGRNWASVVRQVVRARPDWGALLIDLRQHGASQGFAEPHTVAAAAADLVELAENTHLPPDGLLGHSFGGKVALIASALPALAGHLQQVWVIDSTPEAREPAGGAWEMYRVLTALPEEFASRDALVETLQERGIANPVARWMATNLEERGSGYRWRFDRDAVGALLHSFFETDAWPEVEQPPGKLSVHLVRASGSGVMDDGAAARAREAGRTGRVHLHEISGGHWVNADNPEALVDLLRTHLPG